MIVGGNLFGLDQVRVVPSGLGHVSRKTVDIFLRIISPDMTAPPILRLSDIGKDHQRHARFQKILCQRARDDRSRPADMEIIVTHARLLFFHDSVDVACPARHAELERDARKRFLKSRLQLLA